MFQNSILRLFLSNPAAGIILAFCLIMSLTVHEFFHAFVADKLGDPTSRLRGRLTLNPLAHLDPLGTLALLIAGFGWAKPVPVDPYNFENPKRDMSLVALAGPASNFTIAIIFAVFFNMGVAQQTIFSEIFILIVQLNLVLGIFNFVPVAPLDGSKIILSLLPNDLAYEYESFMHQYGFIILLALIFPWYQGMSPISFLVGPVIDFGSRVLLPGIF